ncbi:MAG: ferritin, partial [Gammaproteobacteria bacterium]|nr:ferritin [Gammaproteobacteria bacterium]
MRSKKVNNQPQEIADYPEIDPKDQNAIECINEIFMSPLTGSYNWDYIVVEDRIK